MNDEADINSGELSKISGTGEVPDKIEITDPNTISLEGLNPETRHALRQRVQEEALKLNVRESNAHIDAKAIKDRMDDAGDVVKKATRDETHATITASFDDDLGRTEVIMGNTDTAQKGKLTRSQRGEKDNTLIYVSIAVGAIILLAMILGS